MNTVLFIPYHLEGHIRPTFALCHLLQKNYRVVYAIPKKFKALAEHHQLDYVILESVPFGYGFETVMRRQEGHQRVWRAAYKDRREGRISKHREKKLSDIVGELKPSIIFIDMLSATDFILLYPYLKNANASVAFTNPMLSNYTYWKTPRIGCRLMPNQRLHTAVENILAAGMYHFFHAKEWIRWLGNDNRSIIKRQFNKQGISSAYSMVRRNYVANLFNNVPELILAPQELEFNVKGKRDNQFYLGLQVDTMSAPAGDDLLAPLKATIESWKKEKNAKIVLCAFGSMHGNANQLIAAFIERLSTARLDKMNIKIICAFDDKDNLLDTSSLPPQVRLYNKIPQRQILPYCDLFITHAGLGSVKESIHAGVPMLAYPFTRHWDSTGNAAKIEYHGLGLRGNIERDSVETIEEKILYILNNQAIRNGVLQLRDAVLRRYSDEYVLQVIEQVQNIRIA